MADVLDTSPAPPPAKTDKRKRRRLVRLGFIGTARGLNLGQKAALVKLVAKLGPEEIHVGDHIGSDPEFADLARIFPSRLIFHPHTVDAEHPYRTRAMLARNSTEFVAVVPRLEALRDIVNVAETMVFAPTEREDAKGECWAAIRYAKRRLRQIWFVFPDGQTKRYK